MLGFSLHAPKACNDLRGKKTAQPTICDYVCLRPKPNVLLSVRLDRLGLRVG